MVLVHVRAFSLSGREYVAYHSSRRGPSLAPSHLSRLSGPCSTFELSTHHAESVMIFVSEFVRTTRRKNLEHAQIDSYSRTDKVLLLRTEKV